MDSFDDIPVYNIFASESSGSSDESDFNSDNSSSSSSTATSSSSSRQNSRLNNQEEPTVWIFGYGSLCWYPGVEYENCVTGYIRGYLRRFWQGNSTHRGTTEKPGRVATLIENEKGVTWGCAYKVTGNAALKYLNQRECTLGGYATLYTKFYPRIARENTEITGEAYPVLIYIATPLNVHWMGEESLSTIAQQIVECHGPSGHNVEYLVKLAIFMRNEIPHANDDHLFELEYLVRDILDKKRIPLSTLMGSPLERIRRDSHANSTRPTSFEFTSRVPKTQLRCLNL